jgi:hypothetical protein
MQKRNNVTLDGNFKLWSHDQFMLSLYANSTLKQNEKSRNLPTKLHLRVHHQDNKILGIGVESFDPLTQNSTSPTLSAWALLGTPAVNGFRAFGGAFVGFVPDNKHIPFHRYLVGIKHNLGTAHLELNVNRKLTESTSSKGNLSASSSNERLIALKFDGKANNDLLVGGDVTYNLDNTQCNAKLYGEYILDPATFFKAMLESNQTLSVSLTHQQKGLGLFGFTSSVN